LSRLHTHTHTHAGLSGSCTIGQNASSEELLPGGQSLVASPSGAQSVSAGRCSVSIRRLGKGEPNWAHKGAHNPQCLACLWLAVCSVQCAVCSLQSACVQRINTARDCDCANSPRFSPPSTCTKLLPSRPSALVSRLCPALQLAACLSVCLNGARQEDDCQFASRVVSKLKQLPLILLFRRPVYQATTTQ